MIGLGIMGSAMSKNLLHAGFPVIGYDISAAALEKFAAAGGESATSAGDVAAQSKILITSLPSTAALHEVVAELTRAPHADRVLAETSTFPLDDKTKAQHALAEAGIVMLD